MGKISDLWVRLGLKKDEFDKGVQDVEKKSEGMGKTFSNLKVKAVAVWAAIGGAVLKIGKDITKSTNSMEDRWELFTTKAKAAWQTFVRTIANGDWANFIDNYKKEVQAATYLQEVMQADTEIMNSIAIQKAQMADQLAELEIAMRDQTKSYQERANAARKYLEMVTPIYDKEIERAKKLKAAQYQAFLAGSGFINVTDPKNMAAFDKWIVAYGDLERIASLGGLTFSEAVQKAMTAPALSKGVNLTDKQYNKRITDEWLALQESIGNYVIEQLKMPYENGEVAWQSVKAFFNQYENVRNSEEVQALVDSVIGLENAESARNQETKRVQTALNGINAAIAEQNQILGVEFDSLEEDLSEPIVIELAPVEIDASGADAYLDAWLDDWKQKMTKAQEIADMFTESITHSFSDGTAAFVDSLMNMDKADPSAVIGAIVAPFADLMTQLGEMLIAEGVAVEAAKLSLKSLQGAPAIAAGVALIATAAAIKGGIQKLGNVGAESASSVSSASSGSGVQNIQSEVTIYIEGKLSGSDIVLAGSKTLKNWGR